METESRKLLGDVRFAIEVYGSQLTILALMPCRLIEPSSVGEGAYMNVPPVRWS